MEASRPIQVMLPPPQHIQAQPKPESRSQAANSSDSRNETISVNHALQYTPLTTSVLPAHDRIPLPQITRARESAKLTSSGERKAVQQVLPQYPTSKLKQRLKGLLTPNVLPEYKFKRWPINQEESPTGTKIPDQSEYSLSPIATMVLDMAAIDYKCMPRAQPGPKSKPEARSTVLQNVGKHSQSISISTNSQRTPNAALAKGKSKPQTSNDRSLSGPDDHMLSVSKPVSRPISINLPKPPSFPVSAPIQASIPNIAPEISGQGPAASQEIPEDVKVSQGDSAVHLSLHVRSQREAAEAALQQFQNALLEVFEAQDQLDAGSTAVYETGFFDQINEGDDLDPTLSVRTMQRLLAGLKKLTGMNKLSDISPEHLRRLQILCEPSIDRVQTANLNIHPDADINGQQQWKQSLQRADTGLLSANLLLHTIISSSPDESLLSTEALAWIPSALRNVFESCLIPAIEARPDDSSSDSFRVVTNFKEDIKKLLETGRKTLDLIANVCTKTRGLENAVNPIEFLAAKLIFVQNATTDKSSALGLQTFEKVRKTAMSSLARIFARFPAERSAILDEILASLDKLPSNSRSARQYRLGDGHSIQLISALFMQLVQNTALEAPDSQSKSKKETASKRLGDLENPEDEDDEEDKMQLVDGETDKNQEDVLTKLQRKGHKLFDIAARSAQEIVLYLVRRASKTTKTGDSPYRNVLDLFIEDMVTVFSLPSWPSSELMLRIMATKMIDMAQNEKTASAKNMALECLGTMGSAISKLKSSLSQQRATVSKNGKLDSTVAQHLGRLAEDQDRGGIENMDLVAFNGPFAIVSRHLWTEADQSLRNLSACGYFLAQYAKVVSLVIDVKTFDENDIEAESVRVANFLLDSIAQVGSGTTTIHNFDAVSHEEAELAYTLSVLNMGFCRRFGVIVKTLSSSFSSEQAQVRSRSLKSVVTMLETDSTLLDRDMTIADDVFKCASDDSAMVRDSALSLIARFIIARPALEQKGIQRLLECASDAKVGVQKRALGHLKDIYLKDTRLNLKMTISRVILRRIVDHEDTVADLAKKTMVDIWMTPTLTQLIQSADLAKTKIAIEDLTVDIVSCVSANTEMLCPLLKKFLKSILTSDAKVTGSPRDLCGKIVEVLFEKIISNQDDRGPLMVLTSFAEADPQLIPPSNLGKLQPYLGNLKSENDLFVFKAVISIFSHVLPHLSATHKPLLLDTQNVLMKAISSLGRRTELDTVMSCLQVIDGVLQNTMRLVKLAGSIMMKIKAASVSLSKSQDIVPQLLKLLRIAGALGRHIDIERHWQPFSQEVKDMQGRSVAAYMANTLLPLTGPNQPQKVRVLALESLGSIGQAFPAQFNQKAIRDTFFSIFASSSKNSDSADEEAVKGDKEALKGVVLKVFDELYAHRAKSKEGGENMDEDQEKQELDKLGGDSRTRDGDSAISIITSSVAKITLSLALSSPSENALIATRTLASISHQGLNHPKHSLLAFVALSTCPNEQIASVAHAAHRILHQQHESVCEREYVTAVHEAFEYQRKVIGNPTGALQQAYKSKLALCFEVVNTSGTKYVKKFLSGLVSRVSARLSDESGVTSLEQVLWTRFVVQNMAFFDFSKIDEVLHSVLQLELAYSKKGVEISQLLEAALLTQPVPEGKSTSELAGKDQIMHDVTPSQSVHDIDTVRRLAPLAATLTIMMEGRSYLKRQYGVGRDVRTAITNNKQAKETAKAPTRIHGITGEKFWAKSNSVVEILRDDAGMVTCCQNFVMLMSTDDEINVDEDDILREPSENMGPAEAQSYARSSTPGGVKRKLSASATSTPAKRGPGRPRKEARRSASLSSTDELDAEYDG